MNQSLLAKVGWRLHNNDDSLWGNVLRNKYLTSAGQGKFGQKVSVDCSSTWKGINFGSKLLMEGSKWRVGDGRSVDFWRDKWVPDTGRLQEFAISPLSNDQLAEKVCDYFDQNEWDVQKLRLVLPWHIIHKIMSIYVGRSGNECDRIIWAWSTNGDFSVKSAYDSSLKKDVMTEWKWSFIWKLRIPPKVHYFLWTLMHGKLLTNEQCAARGMNVDTMCIRCKENCESTDHVFRKCRDSIAVWEDICKGISNSVSFNLDWETWIHQNLKCNLLLLDRIPGYLLFSVSLWFMWKWRCKSVFDITFSTPSCAGKIILDYIGEWLDANNNLDENCVRHNCFISWMPPEKDWIKINVDGSHNLERGTISAGGVIRDDVQNWMGGFVLNRGIGSIIDAELWGILEGLKLLWMKGFKKVVVESDSQTAVSLLSNDTPMHHPLSSLICACKELMKNNWNCRIIHIYREGNRVADGLANMGQSMRMGLTLFDKPPDQILGALEDDLKGRAVARLISIG